MMQLRVRGPSGQATIKVEPSVSVAELLELLAGSTGVEVWAQELKAGFPPKPLQLPEDPASASLVSLGLRSGDSLTVTRLANAVPPAANGAGPAEAAAAPPAGVDFDHYSVAGMREDEQLARALALSMEEAVAGPVPEQGQPTADARSAAAAAAASRAPTSESMQAAAAALAAAAQERQQRQQQQQAAAAAAGGVQRPRAASPVCSHPQRTSNCNSGAGPLSVPLPDGTAVVRRIIESDNSCLFNAVGYVMERSRSKAPALRQLIAQEVLKDPMEWNEAVLGKPPREYCSWITHPDKWGGAIELSILSRHYGREIAAFDIQTKRVDIYGQDAGYAERAMVMYDGLHYDSLAVAAGPGAPEWQDVAIVPSSGPRCDAAMAGAAQLTAGLHEARQFTDTANFTLRCGICQLGLKGEKEAVEHAKQTGHTSFREY